jgi:uncharacterized protein (TIGR00369 family)
MSETIRSPKTTAHLTWAMRLERGEEPPPPIAKLIGFTMTGVELGRATGELHADKRHHNPMGTLHGGVVCDVADAAMGFAMSTTLEDDESFTTVDLSVSFLKPVFEGKIFARARVYKRTRTLGFVACDVEDAGGALIARFTSTCMVLRGEQAQNR